MRNIAQLAAETNFESKFFWYVTFMYTFIYEFGLSKPIMIKMLPISNPQEKRSPSLEFRLGKGKTRIWKTFCRIPL